MTFLPFHIVRSFPVQKQAIPYTYPVWEKQCFSLKNLTGFLIGPMFWTLCIQ
jgi:hypothetical protein